MVTLSSTCNTDVQFDFMSHLHQNNISEAKKRLNALNELNPEPMIIWYYKVLLLVQIKNYEEACILLETAENCDSYHAVLFALMKIEIKLVSYNSMI